MRYRTLWNQPLERARVTYPFITWDGQFTEEQCNEISAYCQVNSNMKAGTTFGGADQTVRVSDVAFHGWSEEISWVFEKLHQAITSINDRWYGFDLNGYNGFQYTEYDGEKLGKYDWHMDMHLGNGDVPPDMFETRKLSLSLLLNAPGQDFEGGEFQLNTGSEGGAMTVESRKGRIIAFPSWVIHRVTPVTKGVRRSLVVWVVGPKFT
jgi:PKHD-type hydroxylase